MNSTNNNATNTSGINPKGRKILVRPVPIEKKSKGGLIINITNEREEEMGQVHGILVAVGHNAWANDPDGPWGKVGDKIIFAKYAGQVFIGNDGAWYRIMRDEDMIATVDFIEAQPADAAIYKEASNA